MVTAAAGITAAVAVISGFGITYHNVIAEAHSDSPVPSTVHQIGNGPPVTPASAISRPREKSRHSAVPHTAVARQSSSADPSRAWLESARGQAQVTFNDDVDALAGALETEGYAPTVANHLAFEADARVMRAEAQHILADPALLPTVHRAAYKRMLNDFVVVADLLQPGSGYGTPAQDFAAWDVAVRASNTNFS